MEARTNSKIHIQDDRVIKEYYCDVQKEFEKSIMLWEIAQNNQFNFPKPIKLNVEKKQIEFERIPTLGNLQKKYIEFMSAANQSPKTIRIFGDAGRVLGLVHSNLKLSSSTQWKPNKRFVLAAKRYGFSQLDELVDCCEKVFLHCDYGFANVELSNCSSSTLAIFDASPNYFSTFHPDEHGPIYLDIGKFLANLYGQVPLKYYPYMKWDRIKDLRDSFLLGYTESTNIDCNIKALRVFSYAIASCYFQKKYSNKVMSNMAMKILFSPLKGQIFL